jgi:hypothetical protein
MLNTQLLSVTAGGADGENEGTAVEVSWGGESAAVEPAALVASRREGGAAWSGAGCPGITPPEALNVRRREGTTARKRGCDDASPGFHSTAGGGSGHGRFLHGPGSGGGGEVPVSSAQVMHAQNLEAAHVGAKKRQTGLA